MRSAGGAPTICVWDWRPWPTPTGTGWWRRCPTGTPPGSSGAGTERRQAAAHVDAIGRASAALSRNVREDLLLEALMVELSGMDE